MVTMKVDVHVDVGKRCACGVTPSWIGVSRFEVISMCIMAK